MRDRRQASHRPVPDTARGRRAFLKTSARAAALGVGTAVGLGLGGCSSDDPERARRHQGSSDGSAPRRASGHLEPPDLAAMFRPGVRYRFDEDIGGGEAVIEVHDVGVLDLPTGRLVATDPFWVGVGQDAAYTVTVPPGRYEVDVSLARIDPPDPRPGARRRLGAAARLTIRDEPATTWEMALRPGEDLADLGPEEFYGFGVDAGTGAFLDESAIAPLSRRLEEWEEPENAEVASAVIDGEAVNLVLDETTGLNVVTFDCGMGDGSYPVWIGRGGSGDPTCFIADLELLSRHTSGPIATDR